MNIQDIKILKISIFLISLLLIPIIQTSYETKTTTDMLVPMNYTVDPFSDIHLKSNPNICIFSSNDREIKAGKQAVHDWQVSMQRYTKDYQNWNLTPTVHSKINNIERTGCNVEIYYSKAPQYFDDPTVQGVEKNFEYKGIIEVYTTQIYFPSSFAVVKDTSGKLRPIPNQHPDVPYDNLVTVTEHELGHAFGLGHELQDSIMRQGYLVQHITSKDCKNMVQIHGLDWNTTTKKYFTIVPTEFDR